MALTEGSRRAPARDTHVEKLTDKERAKVIELYLKYGIDQTSLAERFCCGTGCIDAVLRKAGVKRAQGARHSV